MWAKCQKSYLYWCTVAVSSFLSVLVVFFLLLCSIEIHVVGSFMSCHSSKQNILASILKLKIFTVCMTQLIDAFFSSNFVRWAQWPIYQYLPTGIRHSRMNQHHPINSTIIYYTIDNFFSDKETKIDSNLN